MRKASAVLCAVGVLILMTAASASADVVDDNPAVATSGPGTVALFARSSSGAVAARSWSGTAWTPWASIGGNATSGPAANMRPGNIVDVFVRGGDNAIWHKYWNGSAWTTWGSLGGGFTSAPASVVRKGNGNLDVFARGLDGAIWFKTFTAGVGWSGWVSIGGAAASAPAVLSPASNQLVVFVRGTDDQVYENWYNGSAWTGWVPLGGAVTSAPTVASQSPGTWDIFARGTDNAIYQRSWNGSAWSGWARIDTAATSGPAAMSEGPGRVTLYVRGGAQLYYNVYDHGQGPQNGWSGWVAWGPTEPVPQWRFGVGQDVDPDAYAAITGGLRPFTDPAYTKLRTHIYRLTVAWNVMNVQYELDRADRLITEANAAGNDIMVTFREDYANTRAPSVSEYTAAVRAFISRWNGVVDLWGPANEPNAGQTWLGGDPTGPGPVLAAGYYQALVQTAGVGAGRVVGPDLVDRYTSTSSQQSPVLFKYSGHALTAVREWVAAYVSAGGGFGVAAAFHPYGGVKYHNSQSVTDYLNALPGATNVMFTEVGSVISSGGVTRTTEAEQNSQVAYLAGTLINVSPRITRLYYWHVRAPASTDGPSGWDSGLARPTGAARPAWMTYCEFTVGDCSSW